MKPAAIYVWLVPSEQVLEQPGSWRIRKWDTESFPEANYTLPSCAEAAQAGKPVAWRWRWKAGDEPDVWGYMEHEPTNKNMVVEPLYSWSTSARS